MSVHDHQDGRDRLRQNSPYWTSLHSYLLLGLATLACLLPFSGKAFHIDDPLFVWTAQQVAHHPFNPYGFHLVWYVTDMPMSAITKNPPLSSYYGALIGIVAGWSERAWHLGFLLPALALVLGTYRLAERFTASPTMAAPMIECRSNDRRRGHARSLLVSWFPPPA